VVGLWWYSSAHLSCTALLSQEFLSSLCLGAMSLAVKCPLTIPGTLAGLRWRIALTIPGALVAWPRWGTVSSLDSFGTYSTWTSMSVTGTLRVPVITSPDCGQDGNSLTIVILQPYKQRCPERSFELCWTAAGCAQYLGREEWDAFQSTSD